MRTVNLIFATNGIIFFSIFDSSGEAWYASTASYVHCYSRFNTKPSRLGIRSPDLRSYANTIHHSECYFTNCMHVTFLPITHRFLGDAFFKRPVVSPRDVERADSGLRKLLSSPRDAARGSASVGDKRRRLRRCRLRRLRRRRRRRRLRFSSPEINLRSRPHASRAGTRAPQVPPI